MYQNILLAADGSENSLRAAREAARLANCSDDCSITILFIVEPEQANKSAIHTSSKESWETTKKKQVRNVEQVLIEYAVPCHIRVQQGNPASEIIAVANSEDVDLVVIGSRGLNAFKEMLLGSVSQKVMKHVACPVLLVK